MNQIELEARFKALDNVQRVEVTGDGYHHALLIVSDVFEGKSAVARHQWVYSQVREHIASGALHALSIQALTPSEWEIQHG